MLLRMGEFRKITVTVSARDLQLAQEFTGKGITETVRIALKTLAEMRASSRK
jgi:hypothetical protein